MGLSSSNLLCSGLHRLEWSSGKDILKNRIAKVECTWGSKTELRHLGFGSTLGPQGIWGLGRSCCKVLRQGFGGKVGIPVGHVGSCCCLKAYGALIVILQV